MVCAKSMLSETQSIGRDCWQTWRKSYATAHPARLLAGRNGTHAFRCPFQRAAGPHESQPPLRSPVELFHRRSLLSPANPAEMDSTPNRPPLSPLRDQDTPPAEWWAPLFLNQ